MIDSFQRGFYVTQSYCFLSHEHSIFSLNLGVSGLNKYGQIQNLTFNKYSQI